MRRFAWPIILAVVGIVLIVAGGAWFITRIAGLADQLPVASWQTPGEESMTLAPGEYAVSELVGYSLGSGNSPSGLGFTLDSEDVTVTGPQGPVAVRCANCGFTSEEVSVGNDVFQAVAHFDVRAEGTYTVSVAGDGANVAVTPSVAQIFGSMAPTFIPMGIGGLLVLVAIVWAIIAAFVKKKPAAVGPTYPGGAGTGYPTADQQVGYPSAATLAPPPTAPLGQPPGWYADPADPSQKRWWDGQSWSDQTYRG